MGIEQADTHFFCSLCERDRPTHLLSNAFLVDAAGKSESICKQCDGFLSIGLPHLVEKIAQKNKVRQIREPTSPIVKKPNSQTVTPKTHPSFTQNATLNISTPDSVTASPDKKTRKRLASATECEAFGFRCLTLERYIEGFIKGLESAGLDRKHLGVQVSDALNTLLGISQKLGTDRLIVSGRKQSRSSVRRLTRHIDETSLMVEEYVMAVSEACEQQGRRNTPSGY